MHELNQSLKSLIAPPEEEIRRKIWLGKPVQFSPSCSPKALDYWTWYRDAIGSYSDLSIAVSGESIRDPQVTRGPILFSSDGIESTYAKTILGPQGVDIITLPYDLSNKLFDPKEGARTIEGYLAILGFELGCCCTIIGIEGELAPSRRKSQVPRNQVEHTDTWISRWNSYKSPISVISIVYGLSRLKMLRKLLSDGKNKSSFSSCINVINGQAEPAWCGNCWKCFDVAALLAMLEEQPWYTLSKKCVTEELSCMRQFFSSGFDPLGIYDAYLDYAVELKMSEEELVEYLRARLVSK